MRQKWSKGLLVYSSGNQVAFDLPYDGIIPYVHAHKALLGHVALFIDGFCKHEGVFQDYQLRDMEKKLATCP